MGNNTVINNKIYENKIISEILQDKDLISLRTHEVLHKIEENDNLDYKFIINQVNMWLQSPRKDGDTHLMLNRDCSYGVTLQSGIRYHSFGFYRTISQ